MGYCVWGWRRGVAVEGRETACTQFGLIVTRLQRGEAVMLRDSCVAESGLLCARTENTTPSLPAARCLAENLGLSDRPFGPVHCVGVLELHRHRAGAIGDTDLLEDLSQRIGFEDWEIAALLSLLGSPS